jgi:hypothetical protein
MGSGSGTHRLILPRTEPMTSQPPDLAAVLWDMDGTVIDTAVSPAGCCGLSGE